MHADCARWQNRYKTIDTSLYRGKRFVTHSGEGTNNPYYQKREAIVNKIISRIDRLILKVNPDHKFDSETLYSYPDEINRDRLALSLAIKNLCDAVSRLNRKHNTKAQIKSYISAREASFYHINTHYLGIFRSLYGVNTRYINHKDIACSDHFIPENERRYGKRK